MYQLGRPLVLRSFFKCFLRVPQAVGLYCSCHAALSSKGNFQKTYYKTFGTSGRPTWYNDVFLQENELHLGIFENQGNTRIWHLGKCVIHPQNSWCGLSISVFRNHKTHHSYCGLVLMHEAKLDLWYTLYCPLVGLVHWSPPARESVARVTNSLQITHYTSHCK